MGAVVDLMIRDPVRRTVAVLLRLGDRRVPGAAAGTIEIDASQEDLATMANLSRNGVGKILRRLQAEGSISISYRRIVLLRPDAMLLSLSE